MTRRYNPSVDNSNNNNNKDKDDFDSHSFEGKCYLSIYRHPPRTDRSIKLQANMNKTNETNRKISQTFSNVGCFLF